MFNDTATTEIYTLSLHDALPIFRFLSDAEIRAGELDEVDVLVVPGGGFRAMHGQLEPLGEEGDRKSTLLNSSHANISYAVFCLKKKKPSRSATSRDMRLPSGWNR